MKASVLVSRLETLIAEHGDIEVVVWESLNDFAGEVTGVEFADSDQAIGPAIVIESED